MDSLCRKQKLADSFITCDIQWYLKLNVEKLETDQFAIMLRLVQVFAYAHDSRSLFKW